MSDLEKVKKNGLSLEHVKHQTEEICLAAVIQNGRVLQFVQHQTDEICLAAVKKCLCFIICSTAIFQYSRKHSLFTCII